MLKGKIKIANETLTDPFDEKDCVYWKVKIEEYVKRGKRRTWVTRHQLTKRVKFFLKDDTGTVLINSQKADMTNIKRDSEIQTATLFSEELPEHIKKYCEIIGLLNNTIELHSSWITRLKDLDFEGEHDLSELYDRMRQHSTKGNMHAHHKINQNALSLL